MGLASLHPHRHIQPARLDMPAYSSPVCLPDISRFSRLRRLRPGLQTDPASYSCHSFPVPIFYYQKATTFFTASSNIYKKSKTGFHCQISNQNPCIYLSKFRNPALPLLYNTFCVL